MFERFTNRARRVVVLAQDEARILHHNYIGTEHILLGMIREGNGVAAQALDELGIGLETVRQQVQQIIGMGKTEAQSGHIPFTPRAKKVLELALREALQLGNNYIGTEHILLGLTREGHGVAAQVLTGLAGDLSVVRRQVIRLARSGENPDPGEISEGKVALSGRPGIRAMLQDISDRLANVEAHLGISRLATRESGAAEGSGTGVVTDDEGAGRASEGGAADGGAAAVAEGDVGAGSGHADVIEAGAEREAATATDAGPGDGGAAAADAGAEDGGAAAADAGPGDGGAAADDAGAEDGGAAADDASAEDGGPPDAAGGRA